MGSKERTGTWSRNIAGPGCACKGCARRERISIHLKWHPLVGSFITRAQSAGELISIDDVSDLAPTQRTQQVPIAVRSTDLPIDISIGEAINIYWVPESAMGGVQIGVPEVVVKNAYIRSIDRKSANFSSDIALTISLIDSQIINLLDATVSGRLVIVRALA